VVSSVVAAKVSLKRIEDFLLVRNVAKSFFIHSLNKSDELAPVSSEISQDTKKKNRKSSLPAARIEDGRFQWDTSSPFSLKDIDISFPRVYIGIDSIHG
jgi:hypothetical protein